MPMRLHGWRSLEELRPEPSVLVPITATRIFEYEKEEIIGQSILTLIPQILHPEVDEIIRESVSGPQT
jgi:hypothetical protein